MNKLYIFSLLIGLLLLGCNKKEDPCYKLSIVSGNNQQGKNKSALAPLVVKLSDLAGNPKSGVELKFESVATKGGFAFRDPSSYVEGWVYDKYVVTGSDGKASVLNYESLKAGTHQVKVSAYKLNLSECPNGSKDGEVEFTITGVD